MKRFRATIKEKSGAVLHPEYLGDDNVTTSFLIDFWGLNEPDVVDWTIEKINE